MTAAKKNCCIPNCQQHVGGHRPGYDNFPALWWAVCLRHRDAAKNMVARDKVTLEVALFKQIERGAAGHLVGVRRSHKRAAAPSSPTLPLQAAAPPPSPPTPPPTPAVEPVTASSPPQEPPKHPTTALLEEFLDRMAHLADCETVVAQIGGLAKARLLVRSA